jgi:glycosyltransferase involved in cell wall biosynthesis
VKEPSSTVRRLAVVLSHPTQYYSPWFRWIAQHTEIQLRVFYLWDFGVTQQRDPQFGTTFQWDVDLLSGYDSEFVPNLSKNPGAESFFGFNNPDLTRRLKDWRPDAVLLFGYKWASHMRTILWAAIRGVPLIFRGDSHLLGRGNPSLHVRSALRILFSRFAAFLYVGEANREYFQAFGVSPNKLFFTPHSVDAGLFDPANEAHRSAAAKLRQELGLEPGCRVVLFAGKLVSAKQPVELLQAYSRLNMPGTALLFVGDGPEKDKLRAMAAEFAEKGSASRIFFIPFSNQSEIPSRYLASDLFVLPSRGMYETWGLAVNEAMLMGLPCVVSERVGCQRDLVLQGETGWVFNPEDPAGLEKALSAALHEIESPSRRSELREAVARKISRYTYSQTTEGLVSALASLGS